MPRDIIIDSVNVDSKCWVVRSGVRYRYAAEFYDGGFVATGHLDDYDLAHDLFDNNLDYANLPHHIPELDSLVTRNIRTQIENFFSI